MSTRAIHYLQQKDARFEVVKYRHEQKGAAFAARAVGFPLERTIKTLVVSLGKKNHALALVPGGRHLNLKKMAKTCGVKRSEMADTATAERLTGYRVGGISPFGTTCRLRVVMENSLMVFDSVMINAGQRGAMLKMSPADIARLLDCALGDLADTRFPTGSTRY